MMYGFERDETEAVAEKSSPGWDKMELNSEVDREFEPTVDMLIHDYDDEQTIAEEEAINGVEDPQTEISSLQRESEIPLDKLLSMYGYDKNSGHAPTSDEDQLGNDEISRDLNNGQEAGQSVDSAHSSSLYKPMENTDGKPQDTHKFLRSGTRSQAEGGTDSYLHDDGSEKKKRIMVGSAYQAKITPGTCPYGDSPPYENEDKLLWTCGSLSIEDVEKYLVQVTQFQKGESTSEAAPAPIVPKIIQDSEEGLYLLLQCGYNSEEALRRERLNPVRPCDTMSLWSEEECENFEEGLKIYGKDFYLIQQNKVRTRSVGDLVHFYYLWKKSERHDVFVSKTRLQKKEYNLRQHSSTSSNPCHKKSAYPVEDNLLSQSEPETDLEFYLQCTYPTWSRTKPTSNEDNEQI